MKVSRFYCESTMVKNARKDTFNNCELSWEAKRRIKECILFNTEARVEMVGTKYAPVGNGTESGLLQMLQDADIPIHILIKLKLQVDEGYQIRMKSPHDSFRKRSVIAIECGSRPGRVTVYVKGAPEMLVEKCNRMISRNENGIEACNHVDIVDKINTMAERPLRVIGFAFTEMATEEWDQLYENNPDGPSKTFDSRLDKGEQKLVWIGAFGLKDPIRPGVGKAVHYARDKADIGIKLVSGDHKLTAQKVATQQGIFRHNIDCETDEG